MMIVGAKAPEFSLKGAYQESVQEYSLRSCRGKWLVLFFYPADFTFICPTEMVGFSEMAGDFRSAGAEFFLIAVGAALLGYCIGLAVQYFFPGIAVPT